MPFPKLLPSVQEWTGRAFHDNDGTNGVPKMGYDMMTDKMT